MSKRTQLLKPYYYELLDILGYFYLVLVCESVYMSTYWGREVFAWPRVCLRGDYTCVHFNVSMCEWECV